MTDGLVERERRDRWQMNRAGILNFWFYEDEEFELEDGRLVLRGTNGAGKSVTMQSFIPLVLDGDKHPNRLDPFGSKDRKIEYYLLGDKEEHTDRTGYLWVEFYHPAKNIYKTIGIGLRARRGASQLGFWGFVLEDGRRINHDFWLYDRVLQSEGQGKYPLDRKGLEGAIGAGGQVVQEQRGYRDLVNRSLFGFHDKEAYIDLLNLLIQLRSPKLSKDVKPTAIYEVLVRALPPLHEEELRPLSEVMEDMDQLADRLEELKLHRTELEKLNRSYEQYNRYLLYQSGERLLASNDEWQEVKRQLSGLSKELQIAVQEKSDTEKAQASNQEQTVAADTELELLGRSEAMEKQHELDQAEQSLKDTALYTEQAQKRLTAALRVRETAELAADKARKLQEELLGLQQEGLSELEQLAGDMEFAHHGVYARYWSPEPPDEASFLTAWRRDVEAHRNAIGEAIRLADQEREAGQLVAEYDKQLGAMRSERDQAEHAMRRAEDASESALYHWKECLLAWKQSLLQLQLNEAATQAMFAASSELSYERQSVEAVLEPVRSEVDRNRQEIMADKLEQEQRVKQLEAEREALAAEKLAWEQTREPEPARSRARSLTRSGYGAGFGAPLYEVCDFHAHIGAEQRASVELALLGSGLLDAWIRPDGQIGTVGDKDEEVWIVPQPIEWGYTLADVLKPMPSAESGLTEQQIEAALRSFAWGEGFDPDLLSGEQSTLVVGRDYYQFGSIVGKVDPSSHRAQYIGKEARKQYKQSEISRLNQEIAIREGALAELRQRIAGLEAAIQTLQQELSRFPSQDESFAALRRAWSEQYEASTRFRLLLEQENKLADQLRIKQQLWAELKQAFIALTAGWTRLKSLRDLQEASQAVGGYVEGISQLQSDWREYRQRSEEAIRYEADAREQAEIAETEEELRDELFDKQYALRVRVEQLRKLMDELGISDLYGRISALKTRRQELAKEREQLGEAIVASASRIAVLQERRSGLAEREQAADDNLEKRKTYFLAEWRLRLVPEAADSELDGDAAADWLAACRSIVAELEPAVSRSNKERLSGVLQDHFNASKHLLAEYILEADISETGRITLLSMRDRTRPQKPAALLAEMGDMLTEQENLLSEKDRELFEEIILRSVGKSIRQRIQRAELWLRTMNRLMAERDTSSGLKLQLQWVPKAAQSESEMNSDELVELLRRDAHLLRDDEVERLVGHFRSRVQWAKQGAAEEREALRKHIYEMLDYRSWFQFALRYKKGDEAQYRELTDARFNVLSGGEKAMSMYIPLFAATYSRYADASPDAPKIISLDEAFAGVDDENIRDLFGLLTEMEFDYMMTSQVLWGCYDTVPKLGICEIYRPKDANYVTVLRYRWDGRRLEPIAAHGGDLES
ncbi:TIGR02680 family protein [Paenibacillus arenilitoris]|uniref:TIGR02680 family protein n=1 Tax=Paenibacillus arenilitoris TaxID=2772299 RepID=A0A927CRA9_9BACL|nr:TIGR02680 family protein [Paenibacillus arenilitoris]MBD2870801.1 TIGR02680 family protein [Paenibacillus arenilitoris]